MLRKSRWIVSLAVTLLGVPSLVPLHAQQTAADSAQLILDAARVLQREGRDALARDLLQLLRSRWPQSPAALQAGGALSQLPDQPVSGLGRTGFIGYHTALGAWLGIAIPAAFGADGPEPYGAGLLLGAPVGFFGSRAYANKHRISDGQAAVITFASQFGIWQAVGWQDALDIGATTECFPEFGDYCYTTSPDEAKFTASIVGAVAGALVGVATTRKPIPTGHAALISNAGYWGTWFGVATAILTDADDRYHGQGTAALIGGDVAVLAAIPLASKWNPSASRVRLISAGGLAGGLAGLGVSLLTSTEDAKTVVGLVLAGNAAGMITAASLSRDSDGGPLGTAPFQPALLTVDEGIRFGLAAPLPAALLAPRPGNPDARVPGVRVPFWEFASEVRVRRPAPHRRLTR